MVLYLGCGLARYIGTSNRRTRTRFLLRIGIPLRGSLPRTILQWIQKRVWRQLHRYQGTYDLRLRRPILRRRRLPLHSNIVQFQRRRHHGTYIPRPRVRPPEVLYFYHPRRPLPRFHREAVLLQMSSWFSFRCRAFVVGFHGVIGVVFCCVCVSGATYRWGDIFN